MMNSAFRYVTFLILAFVIFNKVAAQKAVYATNNGMTIGFGLGAAYQQSDIANSRGGGFDFSLGSYIYKKENALLSVDWKFRFLAGENRAYDHRINTDGTYSNISYGFFNYDLELGLALNRLRERTRILISVFAGTGITHGIISTDLLDAKSNPYDYSVIDPTLGKKEVYADLLNLSDKKFETKLASKGAVMPTLGINLGYQFSRSFSLGIEHKINFSLTEYKSLTGIDIDNNIMVDSKKDRNHYTSLGFRWIIGGRSSGSVRRYPGTVVNTPKTINNNYERKPDTNQNYVITVPPPVVEIISPSGNTYSTTTGRLDITARVKNVRGKQDIQVVLNENNVGFEYNPFYGNVSSGLTLAEGKNILLITCSNEAGSARDDIIINWNKPVRNALPTVKFIDPASPVNVEKNIFSISVQTRNVEAWQDVTVTVNGTNTSNFNFSPEGVVTTNIPLKEGMNRVEVKGENESGIASDLATITYTKPVKVVLPVIDILIPGNSPFNTYETMQEIRAKITGVKGKENISLAFNGIDMPGFTFNDNSLVLNASVSLKDGSNTLIVTARNVAGQDVKSYVIIKETRPCPFPVLKMIEPAQNELVTDIPSCAVRTEVKNIAGRDQISITLNNRIITNFNFTGNEIIFTASLNAGINSCIIDATSTCGTQKITYSIFYKPAEVVDEKPCLKPGINFSISAISREDGSHELKGTVSNVKNKSDISVTVNGKPYEAFTFVSSTGEINAVFKFNPGSHTVRVTVKNECGQDEYSRVVVIDEVKPCGIRINPGNSSWEFCLVTPSGIIIRDSLTNRTFKYSGRATSLYFKPIAGGGDAVVKGKPYTLQPGQYYLFTGNLTVTISTKNPGSMGQLSVCIISDKEPLFGNGNNRPQSPCEEQGEERKLKKSRESKDDK